MIRVGLRYALRERTRFALTAGGVACAVVLTVFLAGVYRGAVRGSLSYIERSGADVWVGRRGSWNLMRASGLLSDSARRLVLATAGVRAAEPLLSALLPATLRGEPRTLLVIGIDSGADATRPRAVAAGRTTPRAGEIVIDRAFARRAHLALGDSLELAGRLLRVAGISRETNLLVTQYAFVARADLLRLLGLDDRATFLLVRTAPGSSGAVADRIRRTIPDVAAYDSATFLANNRREIASGFLPVLWAIAALGLGVGGAVVALMTYAAVLEKRGDYVLLAALGAGDGIRFIVVLQQAVAAAVIGGAAGLAALAGVQLLMPLLVPEVEFRLDPVLAAAALAGAAVMAALGAALPARVAASAPPMEAFRR